MNIDLIGAYCGIFHKSGFIEEIVGIALRAFTFVMISKGCNVYFMRWKTG